MVWKTEKHRKDYRKAESGTTSSVEVLFIKAGKKGRDKTPNLLEIYFRNLVLSYSFYFDIMTIQTIIVKSVVR